MSVFDEKTRVTRETQAAQGSSDLRSAADCLVVIYTKEPTLLGKHFVLEHSSTRVGRGADNHIVLESDSVSRRHAQFEKRDGAWLVVDVGSSNGTYCNDEPITREAVLKTGDRIKVGSTIFKFLSGAGVEAKYYEEIYRTTILDGLTQIHNKRYLYEALEREILRARRHDTDLVILVFDVDHFKSINDVHGYFTGDFLLIELARFIQPQLRPEAVFARYGGDEFAIILPETSLAAAVTLAEAMLKRVYEHSFVFQTEIVEMTVSLGAALLREGDRGATDLIERAHTCLHFAKNTGRNRVALPMDVESGEEPAPSGHRNRHPVLDVGALLERSLRARPHGHLIAFEIDDESAVVAHLGASTHRAWFGEIVSEVDQSIGDASLLATWRERYVIATLHGMAPAAVASAVAAIKARWTARMPVEPRGAVRRSLRAAVLTPEELAQLGKRAIDVLVGRLPASASMARMPEDDLPVLVAAPKAAISARRTAYRRVEALLDAIGAAVRFIVAVELAVLRDSLDPELVRRAAAVLVKEPIRAKSLALSTWVSLLESLADLVVDAPSDPVQTTLAALRTTGPLHASLAAPLARAATLRAELARGTVVSDDAYGGDEGWLHDLLDRLLAGARPIMLLRLVSVAEIESIEDDTGDHNYALYLHRGAVEHFPIVHEKIAAPLAKSWCYLLSEDGVRPPLLLSPMVFSGTCATCGRVEVYLAEGLTFGPSKSSVSARSVTTCHGGEATLPGNNRTREFNDLLESEADQESPFSEVPTRINITPVNLPAESNRAPAVEERRESVPTFPPSGTSLLPADQLREVENAAAKVGLAGERMALLASLSVGIASSLPVTPSPLGQLHSDLARLNFILGALDGSVPLVQWLTAARDLRQAYVEVAVFERALKSLDGASSSNRPPAKSGER